MSVLFVDLVGFTDRSDRADPEDVRATLRPYHERVKADIESFGGTVEKFIGDAVMAVFGAPVAHEDDAERAVRAALRILETMEALRGEGLDVAVRGAVTTGEAVVALGARPERGEGIVAGDVVNTAARLQGAAPVGAVIVDAATMRSAERAIGFEPLEPVAAKGKQDPIPVWRATTARSRFGVDTELRAETLFVGRDSELALLGRDVRACPARAVDAARDRRRRARRRKEPARLGVSRGDRPPAGSRPLAPGTLPAVRRRHHVLGARRDREGRGRHPRDGHARRGPREAGTRRGSRRRRVRGAWITERLAPLVGAQDEVAGVGREEAFSAWRRYLEALAAASADRSRARGHPLGGQRVARLRGAPPRLGRGRPAHGRRDGAAGALRRAARLGRRPPQLGDDRSLAAVRRRHRAPRLLLARAVGHAGGDTGCPSRASRWQPAVRGAVRADARRAGGPGTELPETVQALIAARLDTLAPELKSLLQDASVLGKVFWTGALAAMGARERDDVLTGLRDLVRREFVRPARVSSMRGEEEFSFWHVLVRDVAYQQIPRVAASEQARRGRGLDREARPRGASPTMRSFSPITTRRRSNSDARRVASVTPTTSSDNSLASRSSRAIAP